MGDKPGLEAALDASLVDETSGARQTINSGGSALVALVDDGTTRIKPAKDDTVAKLTIAQGAALGSNTQALVGGSVSTSAPTYTNGQISPLSLDTAGALRVAATFSATAVGINDSLGNRINPAKEDGNLKDIKDQTDLLSFGTAPGVSALNVLARGRTIEGFSPDPDYQPIDQDENNEVCLNICTAGSLSTRGQILTDEGSYRDDFGGTSLTQVSTGTAVFTSGSREVTGTGFLTEGLNLDWYIKATAHSDICYAKIARVDSDTLIYLDEPYTGANAASSTYTKSKWVPSIVGSGSITVGSSKVNLIGTTTSGDSVRITRQSDYGPLTFYCRASVSQRVANQLVSFGLIEDSIGAYACVRFTGTDNTKCTLYTATSSGASDYESTTVSLPLGKTSVDSLDYRIEQLSHLCRLFINDSLVAVHKTHIPSPYDTMFTSAQVVNTAGVGSATTLSIDTLFANNYDSVEVNITSKGQKKAADSLSVVPALDSRGIEVVSSLVFASVVETTFGSTSEQNHTLIRNPAGSGKNLYVWKFSADTANIAHSSLFRVYYNPTSISGGLAKTFVNRFIGSAVTSVMTGLYGVTGNLLNATNTSARRLLTFNKPENENTAVVEVNGEIVVAPGNDLIVTATHSLVGTTSTLTVLWSEVDIAQ